MFSFSAVVASHTSRHNEIVVLTLFKQLVTYHLYHEDQIYLKEGKKETELRMHESAGNVTINTSMLKRLLVSYPDVHLATATYQMYRYSDIHFFDSHRYVNATYVLNNHTYSMDVLIP